MKTIKEFETNYDEAEELAREAVYNYEVQDVPKVVKGIIDAREEAHFTAYLYGLYEQVIYNAMDCYGIGDELNTIERDIRALLSVEFKRAGKNLDTRN